MSRFDTVAASQSGSEGAFRCATLCAVFVRICHSTGMPPLLKTTNPDSRSALQLPHPTPEGVAAFVELYQRKFGVELEANQALELATRTLQLAYLSMTPCPYASSNYPVSASESQETYQSS